MDEKVENRIKEISSTLFEKSLIDKAKAYDSDISFLIDEVRRLDEIISTKPDLYNNVEKEKFLQFIKELNGLLLKYDIDFPKPY